MDWILIGTVAGSLVTSTFASKEACLGRVAILHDLKIEAKCVEAPKAVSNFITLDGPICYYDAAGRAHC